MTSGAKARAISAGLTARLKAVPFHGSAGRDYEITHSLGLVFPETPQRQIGTERNLHQFSATAGAESYGLAYADYSPATDWESAVNGERDSIVKGFGGSVVDEKRTSVEGYSGEWVRFVGQNTSGELALYFVVRRLYVLHAFAPKGTQRPQNFSEFLNSFRLLSKPKP